MSRFQDIPAGGTPLDTDIFPGVRDPAGTPGDVKFTMADVKAWIAAAAVATAVAGYQSDEDLLYFGDGSDGDATLTTQITLTRDMYYNNLTINAGGSILVAGYRVFVKGILDLSNAPVGAIARNGTTGANGSSTGAAGSAPAAFAGATLGGNVIGTAGTAGTTGALASQAAAPGAAHNGGASGSGGNGGTGTGSSGAGGAARPGASSNYRPLRRPTVNLEYATALITGGTGGPGGGGGSGDGTNSGGGGGSGGTGGCTVLVAARTINRGASTAAACIQSQGGKGGNGGSPATGTGGGGGGAGGAGGGYIWLVYRYLAGALAANAVDITAGSGGNGGTGGGTGGGGRGGASGTGGGYMVVDIQANTMTEVTGSAGGSAAAPSGSAGTVGATAPTSRFAL